jgi:hypothetical protein
VALVNAFVGGAGTLEPGAVFERQPGHGLAGLEPADWQQLPDPRDRPGPASAAELAAECDAVIEWLREGRVPWKAPLPPYAAGRRVVHARVEQLIEAAVRLGLASATMPTVDFQSPVRAQAALNELRAWARRRAAEG